MTTEVCRIRPRAILRHNSVEKPEQISQRKCPRRRYSTGERRAHKIIRLSLFYASYQHDHNLHLVDIKSINIKHEKRVIAHRHDETERERYLKNTFPQ